MRIMALTPSVNTTLSSWLSWIIVSCVIIQQSPRAKERLGAGAEEAKSE